MLTISKWGKFSLVLAIIALCCFIFAGVALASTTDYIGIGAPLYDSPGYSQNPALIGYTNVVKESHTYDYFIKSAQLLSGIDVGVFVEKPLVVTFPTISDLTATQFDLTPAIGKTVSLHFIGTFGEAMCQIVPVIDNVNHTATFIVQKQQLPQSGMVMYIQIDNLRVKNTCLPGTYCVTLQHPCFTGGVSACMALKVVQAVESIYLDLPAGPYTKGSTIDVSGTVWGICGKPWPFDTWPVIIDIVDRKGLTAQDPYAKGLGTFSIENGESVNLNCSASYDPCTGMPICPVVAHTRQLGDKTIFTASLKLPACEQYGLDYTIRARTIESQDTNVDPSIDWTDSFTVQPDLVPAEGLEDFAGATGPGGTHILWSTFEIPGCLMTAPHAWLQAIPQTITLTPGIPCCVSPVSCPAKPIPFDKPYNFCVNVYDKFGNLTPVREVGGLKVDLNAYDANLNMAGIFKDAAGNEIYHIWIPQGATGICVVFYPKVLGNITIEGRSIINGIKSIARCLAVVNEPTQATLDITAKVVKDVIYGYEPDGDPIITEDVPVAGWPLSAAIWLKDDEGNDIHATQDFNVYVSLRGASDGNDKNWAWDIPDYTAPTPGTMIPGNAEEFCAMACIDDKNTDVKADDTQEVSWDTALDVTFNHAGPYDGRGDIYQYGNGLFQNAVGGAGLACTVCHPWNKYIHPYCTVKSHFYIYPSAQFCACTPIYVQALLVGKTNGRVILTNTFIVGPFADPVDLKRVLNAETWQVLSTPQELVGSGGMDSLLAADEFTDILTYKDYQWSSLGPSEELKPLDAYYVKTKQRAIETDPNCYVANYIFKRVTEPGEDMAPTKTVQQGWNFIGTALPDQITLPPAESLSLSGDYWDIPDCDYSTCEGYPSAKLIQPEFLGNMLGTTCEACKQVYNPGGIGLGIDLDVNTQTGNMDIILNDGPNNLANLAGFKSAAVSAGTFEAWALNPLYLVFNGDGYWLYITKTQTLTAEVGQSMVDDVLLTSAEPTP